MNRPATTPLRVGAWCVDPIAGHISKGEEVVRIEARTMRLLMCLAERAGEVVSIDELLDEVWAGVIVTPDSVYQGIASLRRQLGDDSKLSTYIATVPRLGYRMVAPVAPWADAVAPMDPAPRSASDGNALDGKALPSTNGPTASPRKWRAALGAGAAIILALLVTYLSNDWLANRRLAAAAHAFQQKNSVAVLPFLDLTTQEMNEEYFADGMTEELIGDLSKVPGLRVPAPTSSFYFKGKKVPLADIARQLDVAYLLDGSVRKSGDVYRVAVRLVRSDNGYVVWTETYEQPLGDLLKVQKNIAAEATKAIRVSIESAADAR
jgi:transcriptional activator of cad operon